MNVLFSHGRTGKYAISSKYAIKRQVCYLWRQVCYLWQVCYWVLKPVGMYICTGIWNDHRKICNDQQEIRDDQRQHQRPRSRGRRSLPGFPRPWWPWRFLPGAPDYSSMYCTSCVIVYMWGNLYKGPGRTNIHPFPWSICCGEARRCRGTGA